MKLLAQAVSAALLTFGMTAAAQAATYVVQTTGQNFDQRLAQRIEASGGRITARLDAIGVAVVESTDTGFASRARAVAGVRSVVPDVVVPFDVGEVLDVEEAEYSNPPVGTNTDQFYRTQWGLAAIDAAGAWNVGQFGAGATVAVLDSGIRCNHPDLAANLLVAKAKSFVPGEPACNPTVPAGHSSHGTHVAGTIAAPLTGAGTNSGIVGVAPQAKVIPVKVLSSASGSGSFSGIMGGIVYAADQGAQVINMSLGVRGGIGIGGKDVAELVNATARATRYARAKGALVVVSAGNDALNLDAASGLEGCTAAGDCSRYNLRAFPAELPGVLAVSASAPTGWAKAPLTTPLDGVASYTNYGISAIHLAAPGGDSAYAGNENCTLVTTVPCWAFDLVISTTMTGWGWMAGTSMAAPHVSGVAALVYAKHGGNITPAQVESILRRSADQRPGATGKDRYFGHGRVNAARAVGF